VYAKAISTIAERTIPGIRIPRIKPLLRVEAFTKGSNLPSMPFSVPPVVIE
jgi:hypothetical protein